MAIVLAAPSGCARGAAAPRSSVGFWFERNQFDLPSDIVRTLGGELTRSEVISIEGVAFHEVEKAFAGFAVPVTDRRDAFWRVEVVASLPAKGPLPRAGASLSLGPLGGRGAVEFGILA